MVEITFLGHSGVKIRGKRNSIIIDPPNGQQLGIVTPKKVTCDIVLLSQGEVPAHSNLETIDSKVGEVFKIAGPGEYEISGTEIAGFTATSKGSCLADSNKLTVYQIKIDGISILFLGTISKLTQHLTEQLAPVDILLLPVGGKVSVGPKEAVSVITELEPSIVVPIHYSTGEKDGLGGLDQFLEQVGHIPTENLEKLQVTGEKLPEETKIVTLLQSSK